MSHAIYPLIVKMFNISQVGSASSTRDVVISCPTTTPPYLIRALYIYLSQHIPCSYQVHIHSSAMEQCSDSNTERGFFDSSCGPDSCKAVKGKPLLRLTLVWKSGVCVCT